MEQIDKAIALTRKLCKEYVEVSPDIPKDDLKMIKKYEELGYLTLKKTKGNKSKVIYYPTIESKEFEGIAKTIWVYLLVHAMEEAGIHSQLSDNSVATYVSQAWSYDIKPVLVPNKEIGTATINKQKAYIREVFSNENS